MYNTISLSIIAKVLNVDLSLDGISDCTTVEVVDVSEGIREGPFGGVFCESDLLVLDIVLLDVEIVLELFSRFCCRKCRRGGAAGDDSTAAASKKLAYPGGLSR